jgi:hypothetical protein
MGSDDTGNNMLNSAILASTSIPYYRLHQKLKSVRYVTTARKRQYYILHLHKWDGHSQQHQFKLTTLQHVELPTITSSYSSHEPWICVSTGCVITANRDMFIFSGNQGPLTLLTTSRNIMLHEIINSCNLCICMKTRQVQPLLTLCPSCKGMLKLHPASSRPNPMWSWSHRKDSAKLNASYLHNMKSNRMQTA